MAVEHRFTAADKNKFPEETPEVPQVYHLPGIDSILLNRVISFGRAQTIAPSRCLIVKPEHKTWNFNATFFSNGDVLIRRKESFAEGAVKLAFPAFLISKEKVKEVVVLKEKKRNHTKLSAMIRRGVANLREIARSEAGSFATPEPIYVFESTSRKTHIPHVVQVVERADRDLDDWIKNQAREIQRGASIEVFTRHLVHHLEQVSKGLQALMACSKLTHGDLSPVNVFIYGDEAKIADFDSASPGKESEVVEEFTFFLMFIAGAIEDTEVGKLMHLAERLREIAEEGETESMMWVIGRLQKLIANDFGK